MVNEDRPGAKSWQPGQLLMVGIPGYELPSDLEALLSAGRVGGVVLFGRNIKDAEQVRRLVAHCHASAPPGVPLLVAVDQEGGRVQRLREPWTRWPPMRKVGDLRDLEITQAVAHAMGVELVDAGFNLDFAPVVDVDFNHENQVIGDRSFSSDPEVVGRQAAAFVAGMQGAGLATCAKHFPGHGDTSCDSHFQLPRIDHDMARLEKIEFVPFRAAIRAGVASIMSAHVLFPRLDAKRPATLSPEIIGLLRHELHFEGVVFSDDLEMKAVADNFSVEERCLGTLRAGIDSLLVCTHADLRNEMLKMLERAPDALLEGAIGRIVALKGGIANKTEPSEAVDGDEPGLEPPGPPYPEHRELADSLT